MKNTIYPVRPESSPKVAPVKKKDIHESLQEVNDSAEKLNERMTELATRFAAIQKNGVTSRLDDNTVKLFETVLAHMKVMPNDTARAVRAEIDKAFSRLEGEMALVRKYSIMSTIIIIFLVGVLLLH